MNETLLGERDESAPHSSHQLVIGSIAGTTEAFQVDLRAPSSSPTPLPALAHSCSYQGAMNLELADPPVRQQQFANVFPNRNTFTSICQQDLSGGSRARAARPGALRQPRPRRSSRSACLCELGFYDVRARPRREDLRALKRGARRHDRELVARQPEARIAALALRCAAASLMVLG